MINRSKVQLPLRYLLVFPFLLQTSTVVGVVGWLSFQSGQRAVNDLANQLIKKSERLVQQHLDSFLSVPHQINRLSESAISADIIDLKDYEATGQFYWQQAMLHDISWAGYALPSGELAGAGRWIEGQGISTAELSEQTAKKLYNYSTDEQGNRLEQIQTDDYTPTSDAWFVSTQAAGKPMWTPVYAAAGLDNYITISATHPVYAQDRSLQAILVVDLLLSNISDFLEHLNVTPTAQIFILDRQGLLIGSTDADRYPVVADDEENPRLQALHSKNPLVQAAATFLQENPDQIVETASDKLLSFEFLDENHYLSVFPWKDSYGLDWLVVTVVPGSDFMAQIRANTQTTILLCLIALCVAAGLGMATAQWISRPVSRLNQISQELAQTTRTLTPQAPSRVQANIIQIQELQALAQTFDTMALELRQAFTELATVNEGLEHRVEQRTSELESALSELKLAQAQLTHQEKIAALGKVAAGVAHEMNNSMGFIYGNLGYVSEYCHNLLALIDTYQEQYPLTNPAVDALTEEIDFDFLKKDIFKTVDSMVAGIGRVQNIVTSLRTFSYVNKSGRKLVDLHEQLNSTLAMFQNHWSTDDNPSGIQLLQNYGDLPKVHCYPGDLNQVFFNIISNAIEVLMPDRQQPGDLELVRNPCIEIDTWCCGSERVAISIANNGPEIPADIRSMLFDPFFTTKDVGEGIGMGLALSYQIITQQHQGILKCCSTQNNMTAFIIEIPVGG
ncbi:MAG: ATP-binding protein [Cyanobacteria bacterium P01_H01_bin.26]